MNTSRTFTLLTPVTAEALWQQLASILPKVLKLFVRITHTHSDVVVGPVLPTLHGPNGVPDDTCRRYHCSELGVSAHSDLITVMKDDHAYRSVVMVVISATVSRGMFVFKLSSEAVLPQTTEPIDKLHLGCNDNAVDQVVALVRSAVDIKEVG